MTPQQIRIFVDDVKGIIWVNGNPILHLNAEDYDTNQAFNKELYNRVDMQMKHILGIKEPFLLSYA